MKWKTTSSLKEKPSLALCLSRPTRLSGLVMIFWHFSKQCGQDDLVSNDSNSSLLKDGCSGVVLCGIANTATSLNECRLKSNSDSTTSSINNSSFTFLLPSLLHICTSFSSRYVIFYFPSAVKIFAVIMATVHNFIVVIIFLINLNSSVASTLVGLRLRLRIVKPSQSWLSCCHHNIQPSVQPICIISHHIILVHWKTFSLVSYYLVASWRL